MGEIVVKAQLGRQSFYLRDALTLTTDDVTALRMADGVSYHVYEGEAYLSASLDGGYSDNPRIFTAKEQKLFAADGRGIPGQRNRKIRCEYRVTNYGSHPDDPNYTCFHYEMFARSNPEWQTAARALRAGDALLMQWTAHNDNDNNRSIGWCTDELRLFAIGQEGRNPRAWFIDKHTGPDNTARMVRW